jgi:hypothetical protein
LVAGLGAGAAAGAAMASRRSAVSTAKLLLRKAVLQVVHFFDGRSEVDHFRWMEAHELECTHCGRALTPHDGSGGVVRYYQCPGC